MVRLCDSRTNQSSLSRFIAADSEENQEDVHTGPLRWPAASFDPPLIIRRKHRLNCYTLSKFLGAWLYTYFHLRSSRCRRYYDVQHICIYIYIYCMHIYINIYTWSSIGSPLKISLFSRLNIYLLPHWGVYPVQTSPMVQQDQRRRWKERKKKKQKKRPQESAKV